MRDQEDQEAQMGFGVINGLDLFSGIGGLSLALDPWVRTVAYCEKERYAQGVLLSRMATHDIDRAPIWDDVQTLQGRDLPDIDIILGGFPCQDLSVAGTGKGLEGKRSGLFFEIVRLTAELSPKFVFLENVPAIRTKGLERVVKEFTDLGYDCRWTCVSAAELGAPHLRKRWFLLAHRECEQLRDEQRWSSGEEGQREAVTRDDGEEESLAHAPSIGRGQEADERARSCGEVADSDIEGLEERKSWKAGELSTAFGEGWWSVEPNVGRVVDGLPARVDRIKGLGNAVVPSQAREAFKRLIGLTN